MVMFRAGEGYLSLLLFSSDEPGLHEDQGRGLERQNGVGTVLSIQKFLRGCISQGM